MLTATVGAAYGYDVNATDPNAGDVLTYSLDTAPAGMTINAASGLIGWTPSSAQVGSNAVTVRVDDGHGGSATQSFTINVAAANVAPTITSTPVLTATVGAAYSYDVNATDPNAGDVLTYSLDTAPAGMTINAASGLIGWTPSSAQLGSNAVTARVGDGRGGIVTQSFTVIVATDTTPPSTPARLDGSYTGTASVQLTWAASTDNVGVAGYYVYRSIDDRNTIGTTPVATVAGTNWLDMSAAKNVTYYYRVRAYDAAGNLSAVSPYQRVFSKK